MSQSPYNRDELTSDREAWREAYDAYIPIFYGVLGRLARQGYIARASQGLEIIHDFFSEVWPHLGKRYDPEQGTMDAYVTGAFARFARRTLVRDAFWFRHLETEPSPSKAQPESGLDPVDRSRLEQALLALTVEDRELLEARYGTQSMSERELARCYGWTRYKVRDRLAQALVKVSCSFGHSGLISDDELALANALFCEGRSVREAAVSFSLTEPQVRAKRTRILKAIGDALGGSSS